MTIVTRIVCTFVLCWLQCNFHTCVTDKKFVQIL